MNAHTEWLMVSITATHSFVLNRSTWWRYSPGAGRAVITKLADHVSDRGTPDSAILCDLFTDFHPVLSPPCVTEESWFGGGFHVCLHQVESKSLHPFIKSGQAYLG